MRKGCELFTSWGWTRGDPTINWRPVECPSKFKEIIHGAFGPSGPSTSVAVNMSNGEIAFAAVNLANPQFASTANVSNETMVVI
jgi:hypothetical protein